MNKLQISVYRIKYCEFGVGDGAKFFLTRHPLIFTILFKKICMGKKEKMNKAECVANYTFSGL